MDRRGICAAGNLIADIMHRIERYPARGELTSIIGRREMTVGGLACNVPLSLAMLDDQLPVFAAGRIGDDAEGRLILSHFAAHGNIDAGGVLIGAGETSYTLVLNDLHSGERTFFTARGAGAQFDVDDVDLDRLPAKIFHAGYVLLLDSLDGEDPEYGTRMASLLAKARGRGMRTSIDVVSESGGRFSRLVPPAMKYADYCIINEYEAQQVTGVPLRDASGGLLAESIPEALRKMKGFGVSSWAVIHCPEGAFGLDESDRFIGLPCLMLPPGYIRGTTGAGDAFCAGVLYGAHEDLPLMDALRLGTAAAACSLGGPDCASAIKKAPEALAFYHAMGGQ